MKNKPLLDSTTELDPFFYSADTKQDDEIDLFELFSILYQSKLLIAIFCCLIVRSRFLLVVIFTTKMGKQSHDCSTYRSRNV
ncbi:hypothetical protein [Arsenophonus endosymbiont of Bemisia tabaci]|uniref:hypothetical protein n=1 Tax=Arsenophonus endosymbiont of Bemisia tabaci TaxID=536059 RepID=UPI0015F58730|nr:hypothetical protein [Arsenophonus endosymbiont of Bemisia tabaci]CAA2930961.1 hypothetical protein ARSQ2_02101 [Arsenophonus endosymbiont of Bemisia tabaci Q2]